MSAAIPLSSLVITPATDTLHLGEGRTFVAEARDTDSVVVSNPAITWTSSDTRVFTVSNSGHVTSQGEGVASLYASSGGQSDTSTVVVFVQPGWYVQESNTSNNLNGVFFQPNGRDGVAVGDAGTIVRTADAGATWAAQPSNTAFNLNDVWFTTANTGYAVGHGGTVMRTTNGGANWTRLLTVGASANLFGVWFADTQRGWAVGANGLIGVSFDQHLTASATGSASMLMVTGTATAVVLAAVGADGLEPPTAGL